MKPLPLGRRSVPLWIPVGALLLGLGIGAGAMILQTMQIREQEASVHQQIIDSAEQLLSDARAGDRDAIAELRKVVEARKQEIAAMGEAALKPTGDELNSPKMRQAERYLALGRGYSVIRHYPAALSMYREAVGLDPHLADNSDLLVDVRAGLSERDAVEEGLDFALNELGSHGADLIYDLYKDHLGQTGMTAVVVRAMKIVRSGKLLERGTPELKMALRLERAKVCAEYRALLPEAVAHADERSLPFLRALTRKTGCRYKGGVDCFPCLRAEGVPLEDAIAAAAQRSAPDFTRAAPEVQ